MTFFQQTTIGGKAARAIADSHYYLGSESGWDFLNIEEAPLEGYTGDWEKAAIAVMKGGYGWWKAHGKKAIKVYKHEDGTWRDYPSVYVGEEPKSGIKPSYPSVTKNLALSIIVF